jgi:hypothetical protein
VPRFGHNGNEEICEEIIGQIPGIRDRQMLENWVNQYPKDNKH